MFENAKKARLRPDDVAKLLKVSRVTVSLWFNDHTKPHRLLTNEVQKLVDAIDRALEAGSLPVPHEISRRERGLYIRNALQWQSSEAAA